MDEPPNGEVIKVDEDSFGYRPDPDYSTVAGDEPGGTWFSDAFTYRANDGTTDSGLAAYRFWITPINDPPTFVAGADVAVAEGSGAYSAPWATAISPGPANEAGQTVRFDVEVDDEDLFLVAPAVASDGVLTFTPGTSAGIAMATVRAIDDGGLTDYGLPDGMMIPPDDTSDPVTFQIVISHAPRAIDDELTIDEDAGPWLIDVLANDDPAGPVPLTITAVTEPTKGVADVAPDASAVVYTPHADSWGTDTFSYTTDAGPSATVTVTVTPVNDAPVGDTDHFVVLKDAGPVPLDVLDGDIDVDDSALVISSAVNGRGGTVVVAPDRQTLTFRPKAGRTGRTLFTYVVADPGGLRDAVTVYVDVVVPTALEQARTGARR